MKASMGIIDRGLLILIGHWPSEDQMKNNIGIIDRILRVVIAIIIGAWLFTGHLHGWWGVVLGIVAAVFLLTALFAKCPLYTLFGLTSCRRSCPAPQGEDTSEAQETNS
jgi:hypothetical protein